jgi:glucosyl-dolichyl phosphate glucuronosyltransferase
MSRMGTDATLANTHAPTVSVLVCAYTEERWDDLSEAVASVHAQTAPAREIVIVVDHNPPLLARVRQEMGDVVAIANEESQGLSGARNSGVRACSGEVIAFLDDDAVAAPDWLERLCEGYADNRVMGVGGSIAPDWRSPRNRFFPEEFNWVVGCTYRGMPESQAPVRNLIGANMSFRRDVLTQVGGFRSEIGRIGTRPMGCEETELCIRARSAVPDGILLYEPRAAIQHKVPAIRAGWSYFVSRCYSEGLSKARVAGFVGAEDALSNERSYASRTLPAGVARGVMDVVVRRDASGLLRSAAIVVGLTVATAGYTVGRATALRSPRTQTAGGNS